VLLVVRCASALTADELLLVVSKNQPESQQLAEFYATARGVSAGRIAALDLPTGDDISFDAYERDVAAPLSEFLRDNKLEQKVKCLVTFYGVPLRIGARRVTSEDRDEINQLKQKHIDLQAS